MGVTARSSEVGAAADRRRPAARGWIALSALMVAAVAAVAAFRATVPSGEVVGPVPGGSDVVVVPLSPVGGEVAGGLQTRESVEAAVQRAAGTGAGGVRVTADLSWLCPDQQCDLSPLEPIVQRAGELDLRVYVHVNSTPEWIDGRGTWYAPVGVGAERWARLFAQIVSRFGTDVAGYEVWNEPNNPAAWKQGPDPGQYADLLKAVWTAAKEVDPEVQIIGGVLSNNDLGYMHELSEALIARGGTAENRFFYDKLGVHPYAGDDEQGYDPALPAGSRDVRTKFGLKDMTFRGVERLRAQVAEDEGLWRDVVIGEFGYDTRPGSWYHVPDPERARYLVEALRQAVAWPWVEGFTVYAEDGFSVEGTPSEAALQAATAPPPE